MKKRYIVASSAALALLLAACAGSGDLPEGFEKDRVLKKAKYFIKCLNRRDYDKCYQAFNAIMESSMTLKKLQTTMDPIFDVLGKFVRVKGISLTSKKVLGADYAVCTIKCIYEHGAANFTLSLDRDLKLGGLYIK